MKGGDAKGWGSKSTGGAVLCYSSFRYSRAELLDDAAGCACAGAVFVATAASGQSVQQALRISTATPALAALSTLVTLAGAIALSWEAAERARGTSTRCAAAVDRILCAPLFGASSGRSRWFGICELGKEVSLHTAFPAVPPNSAAWASNLWDEWRRHLAPSTRHLAAATVGGLLLFRCLGGRALSFSPSDVRSVGAFARRSLPATMAYATDAQRKALAGFGRLHGCHTCGTKRPPLLPSPAAKAAGSLWIADHQPPLKYVRRRNARLWRRLVRAAPVAQRFYPQCGACSTLQSRAVKSRHFPSMVTHRLVLRPYHLTGALLAGAGTLIGVVAEAHDDDHADEDAVS